MDRYSTLVSWAKTLLPLGALALLSTLFLIARAPRIDDAAIPYADLDALAREQQVSAPAFSGVADDGSILSISAESARPAAQGGPGMRLVEIAAEVTAPGGEVLTLASPGGAVDPEAGAATLDAPVRIASSSGLSVESGAVTADLDGGRIEAAGPLTARLPYGSLEAGGLIAETPEGGGPRLLFHQGVRLVYEPRPDEGAAE